MSERNNTIVRLALFAAGLAALAAVAAFAGRASGIEVEEAPVDAMAHGAESGGETANGLSDTASGFRFRLDTGALRAGTPARLNVGSNATASSSHGSTPRTASRRST